MQVAVKVLVFVFFVMLCMIAVVGYQALRWSFNAAPIILEQAPFSPVKIDGQVVIEETVVSPAPTQPTGLSEYSEPLQPSEPQAPKFQFMPVVGNYPFSPFTFITWADTKSGLGELAQLSNQAAQFQPAFTLFPGDLEADGFTDAGMIEWLSAMSGGRGNGMTDLVFPVRGNHDALDPAGWQGFFNLADRAYALGMVNYTSLDEDLTYSFDYSNAHFVGIDVPGDIETITERQVAFLDQDLSGAEARGLAHAFLFFHGPLYPTGAHAACEARLCETPPQVLPLIEVLNRHPIVAAIFNGHEHLQAYVRLDSSRIPELIHPVEQIVSGAAGAELHDCLYPERADSCAPYTGFVVVRVDGSEFTVSYYQLGQSEPVQVYHLKNDNR